VQPAKRAGSRAVALFDDMLAIGVEIEAPDQTGRERGPEGERDERRIV